MSHQMDDISVFCLCCSVFQADENKLKTKIWNNSESHLKSGKDDVDKAGHTHLEESS